MSRPSAASSLAACETSAWHLLPLLKLRLNSLVMLAVLVSYLVAGHGAIDVPNLVALLLGVLAAAAGSSAINQAIEGDRDRLMERTKNRPVAAGRISRDEAMTFGGLVSLIGVFAVFAAGGALPAALTALTVLLYVFAYTPLKTRTTLNTLVGAIPGALPALVGWTARDPRITAAALVPFAVVFVWQFPHFLAIASVYADQYRRGGFVMLPVVDASGFRTAHRVVAFALVFLPISLLPAVLGIAGTTYALGATLASLLYLIISVRAAVLRTKDAWRSLVRTSLWVLPVLFVLMLIDKLPA